MKHTRKGRNRKVFKQGSSNISFTGRSVTGFAGMAIFSRSFDKFNIPEQLSSITADIDQDKRYPTHELLQQLIALRVIGGEAIEDIRALADPALKGIFQWNHIVYPNTYARQLKKMSWRNNLDLESVNCILSQQVAKPGKLFVTIDSVLLT